MDSDGNYDKDCNSSPLSYKHFHPQRYQDTLKFSEWYGDSNLLADSDLNQNSPTNRCAH
jgi:hypothetical protein